MAKIFASVVASVAAITMIGIGVPIMSSSAQAASKEVKITKQNSTLSRQQIRKTVGVSQYVESVKRSNRSGIRGYAAEYEVDYLKTKPQLMATRVGKGKSSAAVRKFATKSGKGVRIVTNKYVKKSRSGLVVSSYADSDMIKLYGAWVRVSVNLVMSIRYTKRMMVSTGVVVIKFNGVANPKSLYRAADRSNKMLAKRFGIKA